MKISIEYCAMWNYLPKASSLEVELKNNFPQAGISLISSGGGVFEISLNLLYKEREDAPQESKTFTSLLDFVSIRKFTSIKDNKLSSSKVEFSNFFSIIIC